jgi:acetyl-CoA carboxylase carboxyl transferase subunit beta
MEKTKLKDAVRTGVGKSKGREVVICCMDFAFIGGSMGAVVGEKISRGINHSIKTKSIHHDFKIRWSKNDGSGLFFDAISKTSVKLGLLRKKYLTFHYVQTLLEERLHLMLC